MSLAASPEDRVARAFIYGAVLGLVGLLFVGGVTAILVPELATVVGAVGGVLGVAEGVRRGRRTRITHT